MATTLSGLLSDTGRGLISQGFALAAQKSLTRFSTSASNHRLLRRGRRFHSSVLDHHDH